MDHSIGLCSCFVEQRILYIAIKFLHEVEQTVINIDGWETCIKYLKQKVMITKVLFLKRVYVYVISFCKQYCLYNRTVYVKIVKQKTSQKHTKVL